MFQRKPKSSNFTQEKNSVLMAYTVIAAVTSGTGYLILTDTILWPSSQDGIGTYTGWMILTAGLAGVAALFITRGWIGSSGGLGALRAIFGTIVMLVLASLIGGSLIVPVYGTFYAPFIVLSAFLSKPVLAATWFGGVVVAHWLLAHTAARSLALLFEQEKQAQSSLSPLSQAYFYRK